MSRTALTLAQQDGQEIVCSVALLREEARVRWAEEREKRNHLLGGGAKAQLLGIQFDVEVVAAGSNLLSKLVALLSGILGIVLICEFYTEHAAEQRASGVRWKFERHSRQNCSGGSHVRGSEILLDFHDKTGVKDSFSVAAGGRDAL